jgi:hypothetical protein
MLPMVHHVARASAHRCQPFWLCATNIKVAQSHPSTARFEMKEFCKLH